MSSGLQQQTTGRVGHVTPTYIIPPLVRYWIPPHTNPRTYLLHLTSPYYTPHHTGRAEISHHQNSLCFTTTPHSHPPSQGLSFQGREHRRRKNYLRRFSQDAPNGGGGRGTGVKLALQDGVSPTKFFVLAFDFGLALEFGYGQPNYLGMEEWRLGWTWIGMDWVGLDSLDTRHARGDRDTVSEALE